MNKREYLENLNNLWEEMFSTGFGDLDSITFEGEIIVGDIIFSRVTYYPETEATSAHIAFE